MEELPAPPVSPVTSDEKLWIILSHLSLLLGVGFILPLIVYFVKKQDSPVTAEHAKEALNFHITVCLYAIISGFLCLIFIGFAMLALLALASAVLAIVACIKASDGLFYRYPLTIRLI
ncbi:MAG: DUF4870 domain-containing protein [Verrucomicrobiota bacterium]